MTSPYKTRFSLLELDYVFLPGIMGGTVVCEKSVDFGIT